jgi:Ca2+-binding EF-hand superfamily protein
MVHTHEARADAMREELNKYFDFYDKDKSGELSMAEVSIMLQHLNLMPKTKEDQDIIREFFIDLDKDGNGMIDRTDFQTIYFRMDEQLKRMEYTSRKTLGMELGSSEMEVLELMNAFDTADQEGTGFIALSQATNALRQIRRQMTLDQVEDLFSDKIEDKQAIDFTEFAQVATPSSRGLDASKCISVEEASTPRAESFLRKGRKTSDPAEMSTQYRTIRQLLLKKQVPKEYVLSLYDNELLAVLCEYIGVDYDASEDLKLLMSRLNMPSVRDFLERATAYGNKLVDEASATLEANSRGILSSIDFPPKLDYVDL